MRTVIFCEDTTDLLMIQFVLQYKYGWKYEGFLENAETNRLLNKKLSKKENSVEICSCVGIMNIPKNLRGVQEQIEFSTRVEHSLLKVT